MPLYLPDFYHLHPATVCQLSTNSQSLSREYPRLPMYISSLQSRRAGHVGITSTSGHVCSLENLGFMGYVNIYYYDYDGALIFMLLFSSVVARLLSPYHGRL